jgi:hypothetical protein
MTMRTAMPIASRRAFVGLGPQPPFHPFPRLDKVVRCQSSGRIVQEAKMPQMLLSLPAAKILLGRDSREL